MSAHRRPQVPPPRGHRPAQLWAQFWRDHGLAAVLLSCFVLFWIGQALTGWSVFNEERLRHGVDPIALNSYLFSSHFIEATAENWESEFFQMAAFVLLTVKFTQRGSSESKIPGKPHKADEDPNRHRNDPKAPWPVRRGGWALRLYSHSLSLSLVALFILSFAAHAGGGAYLPRLEAAEHGDLGYSVANYLQSAQFWFESFQNWQSEFFSIAVLVLLSIYLREYGSPQSKPVAAPHEEGED